MILREDKRVLNTAKVGKQFIYQYLLNQHRYSIVMPQVDNHQATEVQFINSFRAETRRAGLVNIQYICLARRINFFCRRCSVHGGLIESATQLPDMGHSLVFRLQFFSLVVVLGFCDSFDFLCPSMFCFRYSYSYN